MQLFLDSSTYPGTDRTNPSKNPGQSRHFGPGLSSNQNSVIRFQILLCLSNKIQVNRPLMPGLSWTIQVYPAFLQYIPGMILFADLCNTLKLLIDCLLLGTTLKTLQWFVSQSEFDAGLSARLATSSLDWTDIRPDGLRTG